MRLSALLASVVGLLAALLLTSPAAAAATSFHAWITCDPVTNKIATGVTGQYGVAANTAVKVEFKVESGYYATATTSAKIPATGSTTTVAGKSTASSDLTVKGYTRDFPISGYIFYTEKVTATVKNTAGGILTSRTATCDYDRHTTVTLTCDHDTQTITARVDGVQFNEPQPMGLGIKWERSTTSQNSATDPAFTMQRFTWATHTVSPVNGTITDVGFSSPATDRYYQSQTVWATVSSPYTGRTLGSGTATCVYSDHRND
ncbi:hypothetical protein [Streptomyces sp. SID13031]|uniref:hypothetical protein n=1 Tax=Streptomyces sp. SID13031 TaxID=2706046 RepID=UPI0013C7BD48|nr:hypothetical protein [Streptomyces sp. SID13031]NEA34985.1 hypothetical protein [Streptomyces sp. SID13031]